MNCADNNWDKIKVSYFISSRQDLWVGSYSYSTLFFSSDLWSLNSMQNNTGLANAQTDGRIANWQSTQDNLTYLSYVFVSGIKSR